MPDNNFSFYLMPVCGQSKELSMLYINRKAIKYKFVDLRRVTGAGEDGVRYQS